MTTVEERGADWFIGRKLESVTLVDEPCVSKKLRLSFRNGVSIPFDWADGLPLDAQQKLLSAVDCVVTKMELVGNRIACLEFSNGVYLYQEGSDE